MNYKVFYAGKQLGIAETLFRISIRKSQEFLQETAAYLHSKSYQTNLPFSDVILADVFTKQQQDDVCKSILSYKKNRMACKASVGTTNILVIYVDMKYRQKQFGMSHR